ncbi:MAG: MAPEG family protein [Pseudomonadales bacterium]
MLESLGIGPSAILLPVISLVIWTMIMQFWMIATRLPAISAAKLGPEAGQRTVELAAQLPKEVQWKADNYNHLMEQPTVFYALVLALALAGLGDDLNTGLAWLYVASRVVHSIVQSTNNNVLVRFSLFSLGSVAIVVMAVRGALALI